MRKTDLGRWGEKQAVRHLQNKGYEILEQNFRCRLGEVDIVASRNGTLCFVEVKTRTSLDFGLPCQAVGHRKQEHIRRVAQVYVQRNPKFDHCDLRLDVIEVLRLHTGNYIRHVEGAFGEE